MLSGGTEWAVECVLNPPCPGKCSHCTIDLGYWAGEMGQEGVGLETIFRVQGVSILPPIWQRAVALRFCLQSVLRGISLGDVHVSQIRDGCDFILFLYLKKFFF